MDKKKLSKHLCGKSVLITGASSGIGEQLALELSTIHCHLILVARRGDKLLQIKQQIETKAASVSIFQADLRNDVDMINLLDVLHGLPMSIDIVVNNAGLSIRRSIYESLDRYHDFKRTMAINYFAPVQLLLSIIPLLEDSQGQIINISTINALLAPIPHFAAYQASKSAFDVWLRAISSELQSYGICTTSIYFPLVRTPMIEPTAIYRKIPAMSSTRAARIICKCMYTKKKKYKPLWLLFGQILSLFLTSFGDLCPKYKK
jgi:short-subunit dehydrogenase